MSQTKAPKDPKHYRVGIDVGTNSVGLAAVEFNEMGRPIQILSAISQIHDGGVLEAKTATTRLAAAGVARRMRRLRRRRSKRLIALDKKFAEWGWEPLSDENDPYLPWRARQRLVTEKIADEVERNAHLATALRHMARHRGWRNPYVRVSSLYQIAAPSEFMIGKPATEKKEAVAGFKQRVEDRVGRSFPDDVTVAELAMAAIEHDVSVPLRHGKTEKSHTIKEFSYIGGKLLQSDNANEIHAYARTQGLSDDQVRQLIDLVFVAESPRGSWVSKIGKDPLDNQPRAASATDAFQRFRMVSVLGNVRVKDGGQTRPLAREEMIRSYEYLINLKPGDQPTWGDIGEVIGKTRRALAGAAATNALGEERLPLRPQIHATDHAIRKQKKLGDLRDYWVTADSEHRDALINLIVDGARDETTQAGIAAWDLLNALSEDELAELDKLDVPAGRAAYSVQSLRKLTDYMLTHGVDLHTARKAVFDKDDDWVPPSEPIGAPIGHPSVDRVLKIVARFLAAAESEWGKPERVTIEHVRDAFMSEAKQREIERENQQRFKAKLEQRETVGKSVGNSAKVRDSDVRRFEAVNRQNSQCAYCGDTITYDTSEMDHIVPRMGPGSTNTRNNLVAACIPCNREKLNTPFAVWAKKTSRVGVSVDEAIERVNFWQRDNGVSTKNWAAFKKEVRDRLERTEEDPEIDARSMESVAWMANELRDRIAYQLHGGNTSSGPKRVFVYRGALTAEARRASGIEGKIPWIGGGGKTRLDRRHHAVDAVVQTLLDESVARTLAERMSLRSEQHYKSREPSTWKTYAGFTPAAKERYTTWLASMDQLAALLQKAFDEDRVVVMENLRLRLGSGRVHEDTINPMKRKSVGDAFTRKEIDAASTPQLWIALTRDPDFDEKEGLPANPSRKLRLRGQHLDANDEVELFDKPRAAIAVRGGWAQLGDSIHHARIYRWEERGKTKYGMLRVFTADLLKHRNEDLFNVVPDPSWISMRVAHPSIGQSDLSQKEYVGWVVPGDEFLMTRDAPWLDSLGTISRWKVSGFENEGIMNLLPLVLASEGVSKFLEQANLPTEEANTVKSLIEKRRRGSVNPLFSDSSPVIIRRDSLGRPRLESAAGLPVCWSTV